MTKRDATRIRRDHWARLHIHWYSDPMMRVIADTNPSVLGLWPVLIAMAKAASDEAKNPQGAITITRRDLANYAFMQPRELATVLQHLVDADMVEIGDGPLGCMRLTLTGFGHWQTPRGSKAERDERAGDPICREKAVHGDNNSTTARQQGDNKSTLDKDTDIDIDKDKDNKPITSSDDDAATPQGAATDDARALFNYWLEQTGRSPAANRLTQQRRGRVRARLRDGYTVQQLMAAIRGIANSPWHTGDNPNGKRYDTFDFVMRSAETVERGMDFDVQGANRAAAASAGPRGVNIEATRRYYQELGVDEAVIAEKIRRLQESTGTHGTPNMTTATHGA